MLHLVCEDCEGKGTINSKHFLDKIAAQLGLGEIPDLGTIGGDLPPEDICDLCSGTGFHRKVHQTSESLKRVAVLRLLDLVYPEHKNRLRTQRLLDLFAIVPFVDDDLELTRDAKKVKEAQAKEALKLK